jgi:hypothetical protein
MNNQQQTKVNLQLQLEATRSYLVVLEKIKSKVRIYESKQGEKDTSWNIQSYNTF